jgi:hypothetical protein
MYGLTSLAAVNAIYYYVIRFLDTLAIYIPDSWGTVNAEARAAPGASAPLSELCVSGSAVSIEFVTDIGL